jgi:hypothetical protein
MGRSGADAAGGVPLAGTAPQCGGQYGSILMSCRGSLNAGRRPDR